MGLDEERDVWRLRVQIKEKDARIEELESKLKETQTKLSENIQKLLKQKMDLSLELERIKPSIEKTDSFIEEYSKASLQKIADLKDDIRKVEDNWQLKYDNLEKEYKELEIKHSGENLAKDNEIKRLNQSIEDLKQKLEQEKLITQETGQLREKVRKLEDERLLRDRERKSPEKLKELLEEKEKQIFELKDKLSESSLKIKELSDAAISRPDVIIGEGSLDIIALKTEINTLTKELAFYQGKKIDTIFFGENQTMDCIKDIVENTKRRLMIFIPKLSQLQELNVTKLPKRISIEVGTTADPSDRNQMLFLDSIKDHTNIKLKEYPPADMYAVLSDSSVLFLAFLDEKNIPVGFKLTNDQAIRFLQSLLKDSFFRAKAFKF